MAKNRGANKGEAMLVAGIDQDQTEADNNYANLSPEERGEVALWLTGRKGPLRDAPDWVMNQVGFYAALAFMETGLRWGQRHSM